MKTMKLNRISGMGLTVVVLLFGANLYAQNTGVAKADNTFKENAQKWTNQLKKNVMLNEEQQLKIENLLVDYQKTEAKSDMKNVDQLHATYNDKIESVLNDNQKKLYSSYSTHWWKYISNPASQSAKQSKY